MMTTTTPTEVTTAAVEVRDVTKEFDTGHGASVRALDDVSVDVAPGQFVSLIGPSGCGKSTLLRVIADLEDPTEGSVSVFGLTPTEARGAHRYGIAFQQAGLLPWLTVAKNVRLPLELHGFPKAERNDRVADLIKMVGLSDFADQYPDQLSGGMQQRVAIVRALAERPKLLLMDEPFGALDEMTREHMQNELFRIHVETSAAVVFVTHSISEAVFLSDVVYVFAPRPGRVVARIPLDLRHQGVPNEQLRESPEFFEALRRVRAALHGQELPSDHDEGA